MTIFILQLGRVGDMAQTLPLLRRLREHQPDAAITLACRDEFSRIAAGSTFIDHLIPLPSADLDALRTAGNSREAVRDLQRTLTPDSKYDLAVNFAHDATGVALFSSIPSITASGRVDAPDGKIRLKGDWTKYLFAHSDHRLDNLFNLVDIHLGMGGTPHLPATPCLKPDQSALDQATALLRCAGWTGRMPLIGFQLGASEPHRAWPVHNYAALAKALRDELQLEIALIGGEADRPYARQFARLAAIPTVDLVGRTALEALPAVLAHCRLLVSNDTGPLHVAAAVGLRTVGLYFSTAWFSGTAPYGEGHLVIQSSRPCAPCWDCTECQGMPCRTEMSVEAVLAATKLALGDEAAGAPHFPNLSFYRSRFLTNGTLLYAPLDHRNVSPHYQSALLNRWLWEPVLGVGRDTGFYESARPLILGEPATGRSLLNAFGYVVPWLQEGVHFSAEMATLCAQQAVDWEAIHDLISRLEYLDAAVSQSAEPVGIFKNFCRFEMMDLDDLPVLELAAALGAKYTKLLGMAQSFQAGLKDLSSH